MVAAELKYSRLFTLQAVLTDVYISQHQDSSFVLTMQYHLQVGWLKWVFNISEPSLVQV
jgi:hypothetical protein